MLAYGSSSMKIWRVEKMGKREVPKKLWGQFFSGDSYVILFSYKKSGKDMHIIYFWQGRNSSTVGEARYLWLDECVSKNAYRV